MAGYVLFCLKEFLMEQSGSAHTIGIDVGGTNTKFGIADSTGKIVFQDVIKTDDYNEVTDMIDAIYERIQIYRKDNLVSVKGVGIGAPNGNFYTGTIEDAPNLKWKGTVPLAKLVEEKFGLPAKLTNDANAAALGEMAYGAAKGMKDFIMITLGTGVGSGIVANGQLILGHDGFAGELGHTIVIPDGRPHNHTGLKGSLEVYASATGVVATAREFLTDSAEESLLRVIPDEEMNSKKIYEAAVKGDKIAIRIFEYTGEILGMALANFVMFSSPQAIILFGGLTKSGDMILKPVREHMERNLLPIFRNKVQLLFSELNESDAAILGACSLVVDI